jgi:4-amino-4-deoxy-L-arabinose transferase-like glycosyltransferase
VIARLRGSGQPRPAAGGARSPASEPAPGAERGDRAALALRLGPLAVAIAASAVLNTVRLSQNGYANIFYSAGVRSMLDSWHNFFYVSFDPGGLVTVDKPPLGLWVQVLSAKLFGFTPLSLLLPEALMGVAAVALLYVVLLRRFGVGAAFAGALTMAVFPSFVAVSRANGVDTLLILLLLGACAATISACESGRWRWLITAAVLVGLAFNTKTLAAYLAVPAIAFGYLVCGPARLPRRVLQLLAAGAVMAIVSFAWIAIVEATPASQRPFIGSSTNNTELGLTFEYNGFGRVEGQAGGPGQTHGRPGGYVAASQQRRVNEVRARTHPHPPPPARTFAPSKNIGRERNPVPFGGAPGPFRLFGVGLGDQAGWILPFAFLGLLAALLVWNLDTRDPAPGPGAPERDIDTPEPLRGRRDPRLATTLVLGGWLLTEAVVLSSSKGIVHPYYVSALAPGAGAMTGIGAWALWRLCRRRAPVAGLLLLAATVVATAVCEVVLMHRHDYMRWFVPILLAAAGVCLAAALLSTLLRRSTLTAGAIGAVLALLLVVPTGYASTTWLAPVESTFPAAGPKQTAGQGGLGLNSRDLAITRAIAAYVQSHHPGSRFALLTVAADTAAPYILMGVHAAGSAGYSGVDPSLTGTGLARLVARGEARYVLLGGEYSTRGGNLATQAALRACTELAPFQWNSPVDYPFGLVLFDCAGREVAIIAAERAIKSGG